MCIRDRPYTTRVTKVNAAVLASLALAPKPPTVSRPRGAGGRGRGGAPAAPGQGGAAENPPPAGTAGAGDNTAGRGGRGGRGPAGPGLTRGTSGYDAALRWAMPNPEPDLAGYAVVIRSTTSPLWEREIYVGNVTEYTIPNLSIDDVVIGVKAIDKDGNQSLVSVYEQAPAAGNPQQPQPGRGPADGTQSTPPAVGRGGGQ